MAIKDEFKQKLRTAANKAKTKTGLKVKSYMDGAKHLATGEFVVTKEYRIFLSIFAKFLTQLLLLLSIGELVLAVVAHFGYLSELSTYTKFNTKILIYQMLITFIVLLVFGLFYYWTINGYQTAEDESSLIDIRRFNVWMKFGYYLSFVLLIGLLVLLKQSSEYFYNLSEALSKSIDDMVNNYLKTIEAKEKVDQMHWSYDCCGNTNYEIWFWAKFPTNTSVPFSCCRKDKSECQFQDIKTNQNIESIYKEGCTQIVIASFDGIKSSLQLYRLFQLSVLYIYVILIDIIHQSVCSEYDSMNRPPVAKFPMFYAVVVFITLLCFYSFTFGAYP